MATGLLNGQKVNRRLAGALWEKTAESFLLGRGLKLLQRNFSSRFGEIDLIMEDGDTVVFVEVKYRKSSKHGSGADAVTFHKQGRISQTAAWYLAKNPQRAEQVCRFDVLSIDSQKKDQGINWIKSAFYSTTG
ncbi:MAG: YraN family protein [Xanthomonadales bacterium]|nr:YraN family protein [Xanthomonadales bacterium]